MSRMDENNLKRVSFSVHCDAPEGLDVNSATDVDVDVDTDIDVNVDVDVDVNVDVGVDVELGETELTKDEDDALLLPDILSSDRLSVKWRGVSAFVPNFGAPVQEKETKSGIINRAIDIVGMPRLRKSPNRNNMRQVLHQLNGDASSGSLVALMGPSGSGKTTLLSILAGRSQEIPIVDGKVQFLSPSMAPADSHFYSYKAIKRKIGFVTQFEILFDALTVEETLQFTSQLRLPQEMTREDKNKRALIVIEKLGLSKVKSSIVGGPMRRGLSGGEKKRVSIAVELLTNPSILFLDEPTSGLDSTIALQLVQTLKDLASGGRTVITSIHQPSSRVYACMDDVILLANGHCIYYGNSGYALAYFEKLGNPVPHGMNTADFLLDVANGVEKTSVDTLIQKFKSSGSMRISEDILHEKLNAKCVGDEHDSFVSVCDFNVDTDSSDGSDFDNYKPDEGHNSKIYDTTEQKQQQDSKFPRALSFGRLKSDDSNQSKWPVNWLTQLRILTTRSFRQRRFEVLDTITLVQVLLTSFLVGILWFQSGQEKPLTEENVQDVAGYLFFSLTFMTFFSIFSSIFTFPSEKFIMYKERSSGMYRLSSYYCAKAISDLPLALIFPLLYCIISYWMVGLSQSANFLLFILVVFLNVLNAQSVGLDVGAFFLNVKKAQVAATIYTLLMMLTAGFLVTDIPVWIDWIKYLRYVNARLIKTNVFNGKYYACENPPEGQSVCSVSDLHSLLQHDPNDNVLPQVLALLGFLCLYRTLGYLVLVYRSPK